MSPSSTVSAPRTFTPSFAASTVRTPPVTVRPLRQRMPLLPAALTVRAPSPPRTTGPSAYRALPVVSPPSDRVFTVPAAVVIVTVSSDRSDRHDGPVSAAPSRTSSTGPSASTARTPSNEPVTV